MSGGPLGLVWALALLLAAGLGFFLVKYFLDGGSWASSAFNRHLYNSSGQLASGTVLDRDGDVLSEVVDGQRTYYDNATVRKATLHAVGDLQGNIGTGALNAFADKLTGYSLLNGAFGAQRGNDLYLTIDARYNYTAYEALGGKSGTVAVYNYETGEILCMVSAPSYDPLNVPEDITTNDRYKGAYLNRFLSSTFTPGSVYKTVTLAAALEEIPDLADRTWTCSGSVQMGDETIICSGTHGGAGHRLRLRQQLQRGLRPDRPGAGAGHSGEVHGAGGPDRQLFHQRPAYGKGLL